MISRYSTIQINKTSTGKRYFTNVIYPDIPITDQDLYVITTIGDRLDLLAYDYYGDVALYWIISSANNLPGDSLIPPPGIQLRIPGNVEDIKNLYINLNQVK